MRQILVQKTPYPNQNAKEAQTSQEYLLSESIAVGSLNEALKRVRSGWKDNFRVKLEGKWGSGKPQRGLKPHSGIA